MNKKFVDMGFTVVVYSVNEAHAELEFNLIRKFYLDDNLELSACEKMAYAFADDMVALGYSVNVYKEQICEDYR